MNVLLLSFQSKVVRENRSSFGLLSCSLSLLKIVHKIMHDMCKLQVNVPIDQLHDIICC